MINNYGYHQPNIGAPSVSICIPAYENADGIRRLLESALTQNYTDFELIITDDSRTDAVKNVVDEMMNGFMAYGFVGEDMSSKIRYIKNAERKGPVGNWNEAISHAKGQYVKIMHHADWFTDEYSQRYYVDHLEKHPEADLDFCGTYQVDFGMSEEEKLSVNARRGKGLFKKPRTTAEKRHEVQSKFARGSSDADQALIEKDWKNLYLGNTIGAPSAVLVRKSAIDREHYAYDEALTWLVDEEYYMQILSRNPVFSCTKRPLISIGLSFSQLTERVQDDKELQRKEYTHIYRKYHLENEDPVYMQHLSDVLAHNDTPLQDVAAKDGTYADCKIPKEMYQKSLRAYKNEERKLRLDTNEYLYGKVLNRIKAIGTPKCNVDLLSKALFWLALAVEVGMVVVDKSNLTNPYTGQLFRVTFLLFGVRMVLTKYTRQERSWLLFFLLFGLLSWRISGRNELLRITVFIAACVGMDCKKVLKVMFWGTLGGCLVLVALSLTGIYGVVSLTQDFGTGVDTRWCLGLGHPNALHCMAAMMVVLGLYLYDHKMKLHVYVALLLGDILMYALTKSDLAAALWGADVLFSALLHYNKQLRERNWLYIAGEVLLALGIAFTFVGAVINPADNELLMKIDNLMTGRIATLWDSTFHEGTLSTWFWFGSRMNESFFDLGWVRVVYWYGVIPAIIILSLTFSLLSVMREKKDAAAWIMLYLCAVYTIVEAHLISEFIGRNFLLVVGAMYASYLISGKDTVER